MTIGETYVPGQLSFDDPRPVPVISGEPPADPLVMAIILHENAKVTVAEISNPHREADIELLRIRRERDVIKMQLEAKQAEMDSHMRIKHDIDKRWKAAVDTMALIGDSVAEMGGVAWGNNSYVTPAESEHWKATGAVPLRLQK